MQFSEHFEIDVDDDDDWFDPILDTDTRLFVDPFLIFKERDGPWSTAHGDLIDYFDRAFRLLSGHEDSRCSLQYRRVVTLMQFHEPGELLLGLRRDRYPRFRSWSRTRRADHRGDATGDQAWPGQGNGAL